MSAAPPPAIEQRLSSLVPRVRALRVARGASLLTVVALGSAGTIALLDAASPLPAWVRGLFLSVWLTAVGVLAWRWVLVPWRAEISLAEVAGELEKELPELGERLRAAVTDDPAGPSGAVRAAVAEDTARRTKSVDLARALRVKPVAWLVAGAVSVVLAVAATASLVPGSGERFRRVAVPWYRPGPAAVRVIVTSGEPVVRRGGPVTLTAYAERTGAAPGAPADAVLIITDDPHGSERRLPMTGDGTAFHITVTGVAADFDYCIEIGAARSPWFRVTALDPVELADGTRVEIAAPEYAKRPKRVLAGLTDIDDLQFSAVNFQLKFTQPAAVAHLDWRPEGAAKSDVIALDLAPDRRGATGTFPLTTSGVLRLVLVRESNGKKLRSDTAVSVRVVRDEPPWFEEMSGVTSCPRRARPNARIPIAFVARDDMNVSGAELQYIIGADESKLVTVPIPLLGSGTTRASGRLDFDLAGKGGEGETVRFRLRLTDNRTLDDPKLAPQETFYPPDGWSELKPSATAPSLDQQDIECQHLLLSTALQLAGQATGAASEEADALRTETAGNTALAVDQAVRLNKARDTIREASARLLAGARDAALTPELRPLADATRAVAERPLKVAEEALRAAETDDPTARKDAFTAASVNLGKAHAAIADLQSSNAKLTRDRFDRAKLSELAAHQSALAEAKAGADLLARQRELLARLTAIVAESDPLRRAADAAKAEEVRRLAAELAELAAQFRELDTAARQTTADARAALVAVVVRDQDALGKRAATLFGKLDTAARLAGVAFPVPDDFRRVATLAAAGKTVEALTELEKCAQALERIATAFDKWHADRADPKVAAKQLALWQDDLLARYLAAAKAGGFARLPDEVKAGLRAEQKALHAAIEALALPPDDGVKAARNSAAQHADRVNGSLATEGVGADAAMKLASVALVRLADRTPTVAKRLTDGLREFEKLRLELETTANAVDGVLKIADGKTPDAATNAAIAKRLSGQMEKQRNLIATVAALDLPGLGDRQARVVVALKAAVSDLQDGSPLDMQASQMWARREFERLKLVLEGHTPSDARAEDLFRKLAALADSLDVHGPAITKQHLELGLPVVQDAQRLFALPIPTEAAALWNDARNAVTGAESAFRDAKPDATRARIRIAADAMGKLSYRLNGNESDLDRVGRLAAGRRLAAEKPKELTTSDEAGRQLLREVEELTATRVGAAGQPLKKRALDLYAKLRKPDADRIAADLKALTTVLDELAAKMADIAELTSGTGRAAPVAAPDADSFLPSKPLADALRDLSKQQRALHVQVTNFAAELATRLRPAATNPFPALEAKQRAIASDALALAKQLATAPATNAARAAKFSADQLLLARVRPAKDAAVLAADSFRLFATGDPAWGKLAARQDALTAEMSGLLDSTNAAVAQQIAHTNELARKAGEFAARLEAVAKTFAPDDATGRALTDAAKTSTDASKAFAEAAKKASGGATAEAEKHRVAADALLRSAVEKLVPTAPPTGANATIGAAIRSSERAMREAVDVLGRGDTPAAQKAMRDAATALTEAANGVGK